jgi:hypothetical protein|tara:strand:+ start:1579 stop:1878 length:300 start_codon:yes stop_codon:yes gene_type:complete
MIYPEHIKILMNDALKKNGKRAGRPKGGIPLNREASFKLRVTQYEYDIISIASHVLKEDYHSIMVKTGLEYAIARLVEEGIDVPTSPPPAPNPTACKPK